jgi:hypothetical protein
LIGIEKLDFEAWAETSGTELRVPRYDPDQAIAIYLFDHLGATF